jgi:HAD superfamily hydrolase (TIGR01490 family)
LKGTLAISKICRMKKAAIFDIDGTIIKNISSERVFFRFLFKRKIVTSKDLLRLACIFLSKLFSLKGLYFRKNKYYLKNKEYDKIVSNINECFKNAILPHISKTAIEEIQRLRNEGYLIILLSGTLEPIVECFKEYCNADIGVGTTLCIKDGLITGEIDGTHSYNQGKVKVIKQLAKKYNIDLSSSTAYANQYLDTKFMRLVGNPVAVNATPLLKWYANVNRWKIIEF